VSDSDVGELAELAEAQRGMVARQQALAVGLSPAAIRARLNRGRWQRIHPGIYATFSGEPNRTSLMWAAVLHAGPGAALSHETAAELDGLRRRSMAGERWCGAAEHPPLHVTVPAARHVLPVPGLVIHRTERVTRARHPARTPPRTRIEETVLDLTQAARTFDDAIDWLCRACAGRLTTADHVLAAMALRKKLRWRPELVAALADVADGAHSGLELRYARDVERAHRLPRARRQAKAMRGGRTQYQDNLYDDYGVAVETDGNIAHPGATRWHDIARDNAAAANGIITLRYSWSDVAADPCRVAAQVGEVLRGRGWSGPVRRCGPACSVSDHE
jgi:predicted transcriptional regulator of viral defense system/very-short-patch-repair endonuclease